jgi:hypothetical protein
MTELKALTFIAGFAYSLLIIMGSAIRDSPPITYIGFLNDFPQESTG